MSKNKFYQSKLTDDSLKEFLDFPIKLDSKGKLKVIRKSIDAIKLFLRNYFNTPFNSRVFESRLGTRIHRFIGYPLNEDTKRLITEQISKEIKENFPILRIINIEVGEIPNINRNGFRINLDLDYKNFFRDLNFGDIDMDQTPRIDIYIDVV